MRAVVFDLFRTLVDPEGFSPLAFMRTDRMAKALEIEPSRLLQWWMDTRRERNLHRIPTLKERLRQYCEGTLGVFKDDALIDQALHDADRYHDESLLHPHTEVTEILQELRERRVRIGMLSNCDEHEVRLWPQSPLATLVDAAALSIDTGLLKPDPASYLLVLRKLGNIPQSEAIFAGDGESQELIGAKSIGFGRVLFLRQYVAHTGFHSPEQIAEFENEADETIDDIRKVISHI
jgi:putative hydrolase of the HAD superfamily